MQLDSVRVGFEPSASGCVELMAGTVVDDEKHFASSVPPDQQLEELVKRAPVEDVRELVRESRIVKRDCSEDMRGLAQTVGVYTRLDTDAAPRLVERPIEPETGFVFEDDDAAAGVGFFLIAGNFVRSQAACRSRSARARRLRGRCTEKPS